MWKRINLKLMTASGSILALVAIVEAGRKW